jgi:hypothetical protein
LGKCPDVLYELFGTGLKICVSSLLLSTRPDIWISGDSLAPTRPPTHQQNTWQEEPNSWTRVPFHIEDRISRQLLRIWARENLSYQSIWAFPKGREYFDEFLAGNNICHLSPLPSIIHDGVRDYLDRLKIESYLDDKNFLLAQRSMRILRLCVQTKPAILGNMILRTIYFWNSVGHPIRDTQVLSKYWASRFSVRMGLSNRVDKYSADYVPTWGFRSREVLSIYIVGTAGIEQTTAYLKSRLRCLQ